MANNTLTTSVVAKEALRILDNELGVLDTFHRAHESEYDKSVNGYKPGSTITIRRPADFTVRSGAVADVQDAIEGSVSLAVDTQKGVDMEFSSSDLTLEVSEFSERFIRPAIINLVNTIAQDCFDTFYPTVYNWVGTAGQTINSFSDLSKAPQRLDEMAVPQAMRHCVLSPADHWAMAGNQSGIYVQDIARDSLRAGSLGKLGTMEMWMCQLTPTHTNGSGNGTGTPLVDGASQSVTYDTAKTTWTQTLITDGWGNTKTLTAGTVFTIANVYAVNPKTKAKLDFLQQFTITAAATTHASGGDTNLTISPPIITSGPHQTCDTTAGTDQDDPDDDAAITVVGAASTDYRQNLAYAKGAFAMAMVPMEIPQGANNVARESMNGLSIRIIPVYDGVNDTSMWRLDALYGKKTVDPRLATRISGTA